MGKIVPFTQASTAALYRQQLKRIQEMWKEHLLVPDFPQDKLDDRCISTADVRHVVFYGKIIHHEPNGDRWRYTLKGKSIDGFAMKCVLDVNGSVVIVTAFCL